MWPIYLIISKFIYLYWGLGIATNIKKKTSYEVLKHKWSGKQDLNLQPLGPKPSALPN